MHEQRCHIRNAARASARPRRASFRFFHRHPTSQAGCFLQGGVSACRRRQTHLMFQTAQRGPPGLKSCSVLYCKKCTGPKSKEYQNSSTPGSGICTLRSNATPHSPPARAASLLPDSGFSDKHVMCSTSLDLWSNVPREKAFGRTVVYGSISCGSSLPESTTPASPNRSPLPGQSLSCCSQQSVHQHRVKPRRIASGSESMHTDTS